MLKKRWTSITRELKFFSVEKSTDPILLIAFICSPTLQIIQISGIGTLGQLFRWSFHFSLAFSKNSVRKHLFLKSDLFLSFEGQGFILWFIFSLHEHWFTLSHFCTGHACWSCCRCFHSIITDTYTAATTVPELNLLHLVMGYNIEKERQLA